MSDPEVRMICALCRVERLVAAGVAIEYAVNTVARTIDVHVEQLDALYQEKRAACSASRAFRDRARS
jgi:hypothetical protein